MREMKEESDRAKQEIVDRYNKYFPLGIPSGGEPTA